MRQNMQGQVWSGESLAELPVAEPADQDILHVSQLLPVCAAPSMRQCKHAAPLTLSCCSLFKQFAAC